MPNQTFEAIRSAFDTQLQTLVTTDEVVEEVIFGRGQSTAGFPFIRYFIASLDTFHIAQNDYRRALGFQIDIVQELAQKTETQAEKELGNAMWALFDLLEENWDLSSNVIDDPTGSTSERTDENGRVVVASIIAKPRTFTKYA